MTFAPRAWLRVPPAAVALLVLSSASCAAASGDTRARAWPEPGAMVPVPGRTFAMGSPEGTCPSQEHPQHPVTVAPFELDRTLVTVEAYGACVRSGACTAAGTEQRGAGGGPEQNAFCNADRTDRRDHPINCVDLDQATAYCRWAGKRLPTEEEWECAARGPDDRTYPWGADAPSGQVCWNRLTDGDYAHALGTCPVGAHPSGDAASGAHDLAGNVWEWTSSVWTLAYDKPADSSARVVRGAGWRDHNPIEFRSANRNGTEVTTRVVNLGFRCAR